MTAYSSLFKSRIELGYFPLQALQRRKRPQASLCAFWKPKPPFRFLGTAYIALVIAFPFSYVHHASPGLDNTSIKTIICSSCGKSKKLNGNESSLSTATIDHDGSTKVVAAGQYG